jgi:hypothetical protein
VVGPPRAERRVVDLAVGFRDLHALRAAGDGGIHPRRLAAEESGQAAVALVLPPVVGMVVAEGASHGNPEELAGDRVRGLDRGPPFAVPRELPAERRVLLGLARRRRHLADDLVVRTVRGEAISASIFASRLRGFASAAKARLPGVRRTADEVEHGAAKEDPVLHERRERGRRREGGSDRLVDPRRGG